MRATNLIKKDMENPVLSICVPTYNRLPYLRKQIDYLIGERTPEVEIIVSDNSSSDGTQEYLKSLDDNLGIRVLINEENKGTEGNMYRCAKIASGEYIYFLGDDDYLITGFVNYALKLIKQYNANYYHFNYTAYDDKTRIITKGNGIEEKLNIHNRFLSNRDIVRLVSKHYGPFLFITSNIYKTELVKQSENECQLWVETLRLSILSMKSGTTYIDDESKILCGVNSAWSDRRGDVWFESFPRMFDNLIEHGFSKAEVEEMKNHVLACCIFAYYRSGADRMSVKDWNPRIKELSNTKMKIYYYQFYFKRMLRKLFRTLFRMKDVDIIDNQTSALFRQ